MKLLKEIRRRTRNAALALRGKEVFTPLSRMQVNIEPVKVETFGINKSLSRQLAASLCEAGRTDRFQKDVAREIGEELLRSGFIKTVVINPPGLAGYDASTVSILKAWVRVVRPEKEGAV